MHLNPEITEIIVFQKPQTLLYNVTDILTMLGLITVTTGILWNILFLWSAIVVVSLSIAYIDMRDNQPDLKLMTYVWLLTILYSGPLGLAVYWYTGRTQITTDSIWRRGWRSVAHCYSGCGAGEILGVTIFVGVFAATQSMVAAASFTLAYTFGIALTVGPLLQDEVDLLTAFKDAITSETASIVVMESVAIGVDLYIAGGIAITAPIFWIGLIISLSCGLIAAYPVNVLLIRYGIKEGMMDPRMLEES